ncbi:phosphotransferase family protein [Nonomuraea sp. NPDC050663]|uniref:phosphotransferase family protein n=1 Tax=Nonomuraea sp. NPDC050663 TaxID=3364370 RepID=UPI00378BB79B
MKAIGEGWDNTVHELGGGLLARVGKRPDPGATRREVALLDALAPISPLPVPRVVDSDPARGLIVYHRLAGTPLAEHPDTDPHRLAETLGGFLSVLHTCRIEHPRYTQSMGGQLGAAVQEFEEVAALLPERARILVETFLAGPPPAEPQHEALCHNDLGDEHILLLGDEVTGIIDWTDALVADPARDFALLYRDLGPDFCELMAAGYGPARDPGWEARVAFYARCAIIGDIAYGLRTGERRYADEGLALLERTMA